MIRTRVSRFGAVSLFALVMAGIPAVAHAQATSDTEAANAPGKQDRKIAALPSQIDPADTDTDEPIVVTGSRIPVSTYSTSSPVDVITHEETVLAGARTPAEVLQGSTVTSGTAQINNTFLGYVSEGGPAANTVGLRGLGSQRTLVLLNGRRLAPAGAGPQLVSADLNVLPNAVLQRIEVLREGASSVYGSDAVAGVINLITDDKFNGLTFDAYTDQPVEYTGGGRSYRLAAIAGKTFDRGHLLASIEYRETTALKVGDRADFSCPTDLIYDPTTHEQIGQLTPDGSKLRCFPFMNGGVGTAQNYLLGYSFTTGQVNRYTYANGDINSPINVNDYNIRPLASDRQLQEDVYSPIRTITGYLNGSWETGIGDTEIYGEALFTRRLSHQTYAGQISFDPQQIGTEVYGGTYAGTPLSAYGYPTSPFFPNSLASDAGGLNNFLRVFIVPPPLTSRQQVNFFRGNTGYRGSLGIGDLHFDANFMYARTASTYSVQNIDTRRLRQSLDVVEAPANTPDQYVTIATPGEAGGGGRYTCASNVVNGSYITGANCVAGDFFNPDVLAGNLPSNLFNWLYSDNVGNTTFDQVTGQFVVDGTAFNLPAGPLGFAVGVEYRHDRINDVPSEAAQTNNLYNYSSAGITKGSDEVVEVFGELNIPLLRDKPFFKELSVSASGRYTHYRSYGSDTTYHVGANWAPTPFLRFRGNYGTSFRAPNLYEQFVADQSGFYGAGSDPCDQFSVRFQPGSNRYKNCLADLTAAIGATKAPDFVATGGPQVLTQGGAGRLDAERSTSWGLGAILRPKFADFQFAVDYFNVTVDGEVSLLNTTILTRCYDSDEFRNGNSYCALVGARETAQGNLTSFRNPYLNIAAQKVSGVDFSARYSVGVGSGKLLLNARATRVIHQIYQPFAEEDPTDYNGTLGEQGFAGGPKWVGDAEAQYNVGDFTMRWGVRYVGPMTSNPDDYATPVVDGVLAESDLHTNPYWLHTLSFQYKWDKVGQFTFGVSNLFDRKPEQISSTGSFPRIGNYFNYSGYDFIGRSLFLNVTRSF